MNILFLTNEYPTELRAGGLATYLKNISELLVQSENCNVIIVTASDKHNNRLQVLDNLVVERVYVADIFSSNTSKAWKYLVQSYRLNQRVNKVIIKQQIDIIQYSNHMAVGFFLRKKTPCVCRISSDAILWREALKENYSFNSCINNIHIEDWLEYYSIAKADRVFGPGKFIGNVIEKRIHKKVELIESPFTHTLSQANNRIYLENLNGKKYVLFHSTLSRLKGIHILCKCIGALLKKYPDLYFVFAGQNTNIPYNGKTVNCITLLNQLAGEDKNRVIYLGTLDRFHLYPIISNAFCCLQLSLADNFPNTCVEAMALGKVVIGTYGSGCEQLITRNENGFLIKKNSSEELYKVLSKILDAKEEYIKEICIKAKIRIKNQLSEKKILCKLLALYSSLINSKRI